MKMMSKRQTRVAKSQKQVKLMRLQEKKQALRHEQLPVQAVAPQVAYQSGQVNGNGLTPADLLTTQRQTGNHFVQDLVRRQGSPAAAVLTDAQKWDQDWTTYVG